MKLLPLVLFAVVLGANGMNDTIKRQLANPNSHIIIRNGGFNCGYDADFNDIFFECPVLGESLVTLCISHNNCYNCRRGKRRCDEKLREGIQKLMDLFPAAKCASFAMNRTSNIQQFAYELSPKDRCQEFEV